MSFIKLIKNKPINSPMTERVVPIPFVRNSNEKCSRCLNQKNQLSELIMCCACEENPYVHSSCLQK